MLTSDSKDVDFTQKQAKSGTAQHIFEWGAKEECVNEILFFFFLLISNSFTLQCGHYLQVTAKFHTIYNYL